MGIFTKQRCCSSLDVGLQHFAWPDLILKTTSIRAAGGTKRRQGVGCRFGSKKESRYSRGTHPVIFATSSGGDSVRRGAITSRRSASRIREPRRDGTGPKRTLSEKSVGGG